MSGVGSAQSRKSTTTVHGTGFIIPPEIATLHVVKMCKHATDCVTFPFVDLGRSSCDDNALKVSDFSTNSDSINNEILGIGCPDVS